MVAKVTETIPKIGEKPILTITSDKFNHEIYVKPQIGGFVFYEISVSKGKVPAALEGKFTRMSKAKDAVLAYERTMPETKTVKRDNYAAKVKRERTELIHQGADN